MDLSTGQREMIIEKLAESILDSADLDEKLYWIKNGPDEPLEEMSDNSLLDAAEEAEIKLSDFDLLVYSVDVSLKGQGGRTFLTMEVAVSESDEYNQQLEAREVAKGRILGKMQFEAHRN